MKKAVIKKNKNKPENTKKYFVQSFGHHAFKLVK